MPIETWKTRETGDAERGSRPLAVSHGENRVLQHTLHGEPLTRGGPENQRGENHAPAAHYNGHAPYRDPHAPKEAAPPDPRAKKCKANNNTCNGWATATGFCRPHSVSAS